jgi:hypothetical protein
MRLLWPRLRPITVTSIGSPGRSGLDDVPELGGRPVTEQRAVAADRHRGCLEGEPVRGLRGLEKVDAGMDAVQPPAGDPVGDRAPAHAGGEKLPARDHAVLSCRSRGHDQVDRCAFFATRSLGIAERRFRHLCCAFFGTRRSARIEWRLRHRIRGGGHGRSTSVPQLRLGRPDCDKVVTRGGGFP